MHKFTIFEKSNKFYWSINRIYYSSLFFCLGVLLLKKYVFKFEENIIDKILQFAVISITVLGLFFKFKGFTQIEPLHGKLDGYLIFSLDNIQIKDEIFPIESVKKIKISNDDYHGLLIGTSRGNMGPALSNGTNNHIIIYTENGQSKKYNFELLNSNDFQNVRNILIEYHLNNKIDFEELAHVLGEKSSSEVRVFKEEILKIKHCR